MKNKKLKAFTLLEMIIVVAIIAILSAIAIPKYNSARKSAIVAAHNSNVQTIKTAALLLDSENKEQNLDITSVSKYLDGGKAPDINKSIPGYEGGWKVSKDSSGNIIVTPGLMKIENDKIVPDN